MKTSGTSIHQDGLRAEELHYNPKERYHKTNQTKKNRCTILISISIKTPQKQLRSEYEHESYHRKNQ